MLLQRKTKSNQLVQGAQIVDFRRRLRRAVMDAAARFLESNLQWSEYFFDLRFLLNRALPIVEEHLAGTTSKGAIDLALAWAEEWPTMNASQRKVCLQAQTVMASELLKLVTDEMLLLHPPFQQLVQERDESWRGMGIPFAYVKSQNPPGRSDMHQRQLSNGVVHHRGDLLREKRGLRLPKQHRLVTTEA